MKVFMKIVISIVLLVALAGMFVFARNSTRPQSVVPVQDTTSTQINALRDRIAAFYLDPTAQTYLKDQEISDATFDELRQELDGINGSTSQKQEILAAIDQLKWKYQGLSYVDTLFQSESGKVLAGDKLASDRVLKTGISKEQLENLQTEYLEKEPKWVMREASQEQIDDEMVETLKTLFEYAKTEVDQYLVAKEALAKVEAIKIEDGQLGNIARAMRDFENQLAKITDKNLTEDLEKSTDRYLNRFLTTFKDLVEEMPGYYDIALVAVEPSKKLTTLLTENQSVLVVTETETVTELTEIIEYYVEEEVTEAWVPVETEVVTEAETVAPVEEVTEAPVVEETVASE